jgi:anhydro-N-acetylmuramic acid kinase
MSGTSVDGIDAALVEITGTTLDLQVNLLSGNTYPYPTPLREQILALCAGAPISLDEFADLDDAIAIEFALAAQKIQSGNPPAELIGSHGQTVFHRPRKGENLDRGKLQMGYSIQLGRGEVIADLSGITTVSNFRVADIAAGGQGAPLVPKVDACLLSHPTLTRCIQNLGGIANVTYIPSRQELNWEAQVRGWDTGPGNVLLDLAVEKLTEGRQTFDQNGNWASRGTACKKLVQQWLEQEFFPQSPPKSTGRELFGPAYLNQCWLEAQAENLTEEDFLATLTELTVAAIVHSYQNFLPQLPDEVLLCGGGSRNLYLRQRLQTNLGTQVKVLTTDEVGLNGDFKEAIAFAVLAYWRYCCSVPGNLPQVTGAKKPVLLGEIQLKLF